MVNATSSASRSSNRGSGKHSGFLQRTAPVSPGAVFPPAHSVRAWGVRGGSAAPGQLFESVHGLPKAVTFRITCAGALRRSRLERPSIAALQWDAPPPGGGTVGHPVLVEDADATAATATSPATTTAADTQASADPLAPDVGPVAGTAAPLADGDRKALAAVMEVDRHEIAAAGDALSRNVEGEVRGYAQALRDDHTRNLEATRQLMGDGPAAGGASAGTDAAASAGAGAGAAAAPEAGPGAGGVQTPADPALVAMREKHDAERERLLALQGKEFATAWADAMVKGHEEALAKLDNELIPGASDAGVKQHLQETRAAISRHLDTARSLQSGGTGDAE